MCRAVAGRVGLGNTEKMSPSLQAYLTENSTVSVYADNKMITENVTLLDGAAVAILGGIICNLLDKNNDKEKEINKSIVTKLNKSACPLNYLLLKK